MDDNDLSNGEIVSISLIEAKLPLRIPRGAGVVPSSSGGDSFALGVPGVTVLLDSVLTWSPIVPSLGGSASATCTVVNVNTAASDHPGDARAQIRHIHDERSPGFRRRIEANRDSPIDVGECKSFSNIISVGRLYDGRKTFHDSEFSGANGLDNQ